MAENEGSVTQWIKNSKEGDPEAARSLWERYFTRMVRLANAKLNAARHLGLVEDGEDAALSAIDSLLGGLAQGKFTTLSDREDLWKLLVVITARKAYDQVERARTAKRGSGRVMVESALDPDGDGKWTLDALASREATPEFTAMVLEQCRALLAALPDDESREIAVWKMEGHTRQEIADRLACSSRTVAYRLEYIRKLWENLQ